MNDQESQSSLSMVTFNLLGRDVSRNVPPSAFEDNISIMEDSQEIISLIGFDMVSSFPQNGTETIEIINYPEHGILGEIILMDSDLEQLAQWDVTYTPNSNFFGIDSFSYKITNPNNKL